MNKLTLFRQSEAWDSRYNLPTCPKINNPHLCVALARKICWPEELFEKVDFVNFISLCYRIDGGIFRWPDGGGGLYSHDEAIGAAATSCAFANVFLYQLDRQKGYLDNERPFKPRLKTYVYRFGWAIAYIKRRAFERVTPIDRAWFALYLIFQAIAFSPKKHRGQDGLLLSWLMIDDMENLRGIKLAAKFWRFRTRKIGPKWCFEKYMTEYPVFYNTAPDTFRRICEY